MTTWTPAAQQSETWTAEQGGRLIRVFDPLVFARRPIFDTGPTAGTWDAKTKQTETWTNE
jgi:hypothetical protein